MYLAIDNDNKVHVYLYDNTEISSEEIALPEESDIYKLYNMVSASISGNNVIVNTFNASNEKLKTYTLPKPSSETLPKDDISAGENNNETQE